MPCLRYQPSIVTGRGSDGPAYDRRHRAGKGCVRDLRAWCYRCRLAATRATARRVHAMGRAVVAGPRRNGSLRFLAPLGTLVFRPRSYRSPHSTRIRQTVPPGGACGILLAHNHQRVTDGCTSRSSQPSRRPSVPSDEPLATTPSPVASFCAATLASAA